MNDAAIVVTGIGLRAPGATGLDAFWSLMNAPEARHPAPLQLGLPLRNPLAFAAGDVAGPAPSRATRLAQAALHDALAAAGLPDGRDAGLFIGTALGSIDAFEAGSADNRYGLAAELAAALGVAGPVEVTSTACASSLYALGAALDRLRAGELDVALAGGVELCCRIGHGCFNRLGALDPERCRPFDRARQGTVFGEGAAFLVLERASHARRRGLREPWITVEGFGWSCDAHHLTAPEPGGAAMLAAMQEALARAGRSHDEVDVVVPHGTGTALNDEVEARCLAALLGARVGDVPLLPVKALIGHTAGAAGAFGCVAAALMLQRGQVPGNAWLDEAAFPELCLPRRPHALQRARTALVNAYAFAGNNASVLMGARDHAS